MEIKGRKPSRGCGHPPQATKPTKPLPDCPDSHRRWRNSVADGDLAEGERLAASACMSAGQMFAPEEAAALQVECEVAAEGEGEVASAMGVTSAAAAALMDEETENAILNVSAASSKAHSA